VTVKIEFEIKISNSKWQTLHNLINAWV